MTFPRAPATQPSSEPCRASDLVKLLSVIPKTGPTEAHLCALNVQTTGDVPLEDIVPGSYLPSPEIDEGVRHQSSYKEMCARNASSFSNGCPTPGVEDFQKRASDLLFDNEDVFRHLEQRSTTSGVIIKVSWFRKFWEKLLLVAEHWDTSTDGLYGDPDSITGKAYIGRRVFKGQDMPLIYLEDVVKEFSEAIAWAWNCRYIPPKTQPWLEIGNLRQCVPQTAGIHSTPRNRDEARKGFTEGPLMGVLATMNPELPSQAKDSTASNSSGNLQMVLKDISLAIMLAQKRARQGKQQPVAGHKKWWTEIPRWGGGPGGQIGILEQSVDHFRDPNSARRSRDLAVKRYKRLHPPCSSWDRGIHYRQIGKEPHAQYDDVYLISAMNHHISIVRVRVPDRYLQTLTTGSDEILGEPMMVQRSQWFDLLVPDGRLQAMRGLWGALGWLLRSDPEAKFNE